MKKIKAIQSIGEILLVIGSVMYVYGMLVLETQGLTLAICCVYAASVVCMLIGRIGTRDERRAEREAEKAAREAKKTAKRAA